MTKTVLVECRCSHGTRNFWTGEEQLSCVVSQCSGQPPALFTKSIVNNKRTLIEDYYLTY